MSTSSVLPVLTEAGTISSIIGEMAEVQTQNQLACSSCNVVDSCGNGIIEKYFSGKIFATQVRNHLKAKIGDRVIIAIPKSSLTRASTVVYIVPLVAMFVISITAQYIGANENWTILAALTGLAMGLLYTKYYNRKIHSNESFLPKMVSIVETENNNLENRQVIPIITK